MVGQGKILRHPLDILAIFRCKGTQCMLDLQPELAKDALGDVSRRLCAEIDAHSFAANKLYDGLQLLQQCPRGFLEYEVSLVYDDNQLRCSPVAHFRKLV